ncbi:tetratricopeptide repeat protein [Geomonas paludis]|uniref:Tetratricopeptide repeat protein n=1 Tax=Geomonas paludis TaxID=2740185 RepID=A0A6V8MUM4_9BACT|nr:tetratricopeptide repeat protein [Geomonas paludis]UPU38205.1 tetratricopeptide repeat protein [Geomonas paludis]GFO63263.1 hypothetical protein GMPD_11820 [Geomonas paludis]
MLRVLQAVVLVITVSLPLAPAFAVQEVYVGTLDLVEVSGRDCRGYTNSRPIELVLERRQGGALTAIEGYLYGPQMEPGRIRGTDPAHLTVVYPGADRSSGEHRLSLSFDHDVLSGEMREAHLDAAADGCNFDRAFITALKADALLASKKADNARQLFRARELELEAWRYLESSAYEQAEANLLQALEIRKRIYGEEAAEVATGLAELGKLFRHTGDYQKAEQNLLAALEMQERFPGKESSEYVETLRQLGYCYFAGGVISKAERMLREALEIREKMLGRNDPAVAVILLDLAPVLVAGAQVIEAEIFLKRALEIVEYSYGPVHREVITVATYLAAFYEETGRTEESLALYRKSQDIREQIDPDGAETLQGMVDLGGKYLAARRYDDALKCGRSVLETRERLFGSEHLSVAATLDFLAGICTSAGRPLEAEALLRRSLNLKEKLLGQGSKEYIQGVYALANHYFNNGRKAEGKELIMRMLKSGNMVIPPAG